MSSPLASNFARSSFRNLCLASALRRTNSIRDLVAFICDLLSPFAKIPVNAYTHICIQHANISTHNTHKHNSPFRAETAAENTVQHLRSPASNCVLLFLEIARSGGGGFGSEAEVNLGEHEPTPISHSPKQIRHSRDLKNSLHRKLCIPIYIQLYE